MTVSPYLPPDFRHLQVISDLRAIAGAASDPTLERIARGIPGRARAATVARLIGPLGCRMDTDTRHDLEHQLQLAATLPEQDLEGFVTATAVLLADRLQWGTGQDDLFWHYDAHRDTYLALAPEVRAVVMQAFALAHRVGRVDLERPPTADEQVSCPRSEVLDALRGVARGLSSDDILQVAAADHGIEAELHAEALRQVLDQEEALLPAGDERWFPGEVVNLSSHVPSSPGFAACTALVLIEAIMRDDPEDTTEFRWMNVGAGYFGLEARARGAILSGFRHLHESAPGWDPYWEWKPEKIARDGVAIPFAPA